jgi:hypothetical protein
MSIQGLRIKSRLNYSQEIVVVKCTPLGLVRSFGSPPVFREGCTWLLRSSPFADTLEN